MTRLALYCYFLAAALALGGLLAYVHAHYLHAFTLLPL